ncbi:MAG: PLP-dependent aminotransferase family protein [Deltaproteobacteria bacterium]|nr:PLP-dependent aminotransferase family protein [Deltaproteobacteria bacterium]MBW2017419.1 PLP-dependent aminotransferase family protein [Deltaproteobacteria bacterium]MBW2127787.1 PLP-dependent aminotransferase family protein [Deltaproteobacteria bacterium]MBW2304383.1 PLP-dependent aminotransferase family protein [Deltaproteobacteria bacterium]
MPRPIELLYSRTTASMKHSFIREILKVTKGVPGMISFAGGLPSPDAFPKKLLADLFFKVLREEGDEVLQYGASDGDMVFKEIIKDFEEVPYLSNSEIMITVGSTNGIYYFTRTLVDPGDYVICEAPGFPGSLAAMEACGARMIGVEMDEFGMIPEQLEMTLKGLFDGGRSVKFIYVIPEFQNPTGKTMDLQRRRRIIEIAMEFDLPILEDQPYRELRYSGERIITLWELARTEFDDPKRVTIAKSFSKILGPGLRLGFAAGPPEILGPMVKWAQKSTVSPDCVTQRVTARFIERGLMREHIRKIIDLYRPRRDAMLEALDAHMPPDARWTVPEGGMFIWVSLDQGLNTDRLFDRALEHQVAFIPGSKFYPEGIVKSNELRLNFSYTDVDLIHEGIKRLGNLLC